MHPGRYPSSDVVSSWKVNPAHNKFKSLLNLPSESLDGLRFEETPASSHGRQAVIRGDLSSPWRQRVALISQLILHRRARISSPLNRSRTIEPSRSTLVFVLNRENIGGK